MFNVGAKVICKTKPPDGHYQCNIGDIFTITQKGGTAFCVDGPDSDNTRWFYTSQFDVIPTLGMHKPLGIPHGKTTKNC